MKVLSLGLYAEGSTDYDFLPPLIRRTAQQILAQYERNEVDEASVFVIKPTKGQDKGRVENILQAARDASGYHVLIVHADADDPKPDKARVERIEPGFKRVEQEKEDVCRHLVPIIPIQAIEGWILADYKSLLAEIGTRMHPRDLDIPEKAKLVETISKPKNRLNAAVQKAYANRTKRRREIDINFLYKSMGEQINLDRLNQVPAYQQFVNDLTEALKKLNFIY